MRALSIFISCLISLMISSVAVANTAVATFAGGCFWCLQSDFDKVEGVLHTIVGFTGGKSESPTYKEVSKGDTGHYEAVQITYDPHKISYEKLLDIFWHNVDPTDAKGQFCDRGDQYRAAIFYHNAEQKKMALQSEEILLSSGRFTQVVTPVLPYANFYPAEEYHQKYYKKHPIRYKFYRYQCGRDQRLSEIWSK